jgi:hypothetical protein
MKPSLAVLTLAAALAAPALAHAQRSVSASADVGVSIPINAYVNLSSSSISIPAPTAADVAAGVSKPGYITLSYGSNGTMALGYEFTSGGNLQGAGGNATLGLGRLRLSVDGGAPETMAWYGNQWRDGIPAGDHVETLAFTLGLDYSVKPDVYSATWQVTLSAY